MTALKHARAVALAVCALPAASPAGAPAAGQDPGLRIAVIEGENSINIIDRGTAVQTLVEVRDRNGLPVPGATCALPARRRGHGDAERPPAAGGADDERGSAGRRWR